MYLTWQQIATAGHDETRINIFNDLIHDVSKRTFRPALGATWSHCVDTRIVLEKRPLVTAAGGRSRSSFGGTSFDISRGDDNDNCSLELQSDVAIAPTPSMYGFERSLRVTKSPRLGVVAASYEIQEGGIYATM